MKNLFSLLALVFILALSTKAIAQKNSSDYNTPLIALTVLPPPVPSFVNQPGSTGLAAITANLITPINPPQLSVNAIPPIGVNLSMAEFATVTPVLPLPPPIIPPPEIIIVDANVQGFTGREVKIAITDSRQVVWVLKQDNVTLIRVVYSGSFSEDGSVAMRPNVGDILTFEIK